jgi:glutamate-ammonia-ligase adenylyltransferase
MISSPKVGVDRSSLLARLVSAPYLFEPEHANRRIEGWLGEIASDHALSIGELLAASPSAKTIFASIAEASPYLFDLITADAARTLRLLECDPDKHIVTLIEGTLASLKEVDSEADVMQLLRKMKSEAALLIALCDIGGVWPVMRVTQVLTDIAITAVHGALDYLLMHEVRRGRLKARTIDAAEEGSGLIVFAMGKMGAGELNYSSDIDLIVFFDLDSTSLVSDIEPQPFFVRITQALSRLLQQRTVDGYVFRVDLRLRPDPASTAVALSTAAALDYYEREGRTWERAAMIKAYPCAGDIRAGVRLLTELSPFVWRKYLDFAALADVHDMKRRMQAFKGHADLAIEGHNVKIGRGGIREIEFFAQTQQLIAGGRHPELRVRQTLGALEILAAKKWIAYDVKDELSEAYQFLRRVEHRLQMIADEQTHTLPQDAEALERFSRFFGYKNFELFSLDLSKQLERVQKHYSALFEADHAAAAKQAVVDYRAGPEDARLMAHLANLGFTDRKMVAESVLRWVQGEYRVFKVETARQSFEHLVPLFIDEFAEAESPDGAVIAFDRFLQALQRGNRLLTLLAQNKDLLALVALIIGAAPRLGDMLARQPQLMDALIDPHFFGAVPDQDEISGRLTEILADASVYEEMLDRLRIFGQENLFLIGTRILSGTISAQNAGFAFADVAEGIVRSVDVLVAEQFARQYGKISGQETAILAMGKLGSREMTASSDLDLILIYDCDQDHPESDGPRSLNGAQYFARLTQRLISAFSTRTNYGVLYDIDMRLRPSGRAGPVASRIDAFTDYQKQEAWTWEHMALTRARVISSSGLLKERIEKDIRDVLTQPRDAGIVAMDVLEMRRAISQEKGEGDVWDMKYAAGGLVDIEFIAQYLQLIHAAKNPQILSVNTLTVLENAARFGFLSPVVADVLRSACRLYQNLNQILRLCVSTNFQPATAGEDLLRILARAGDAPNFSVLEARVREMQEDVRGVFLEVLGGQD